MDSLAKELQENYAYLDPEIKILLQSLEFSENEKLHLYEMIKG